MVRWRYASSRVVVAGLGRMGIATGLRPRSCERTRRWQAHDYRRRAGLLRAGEIGSVENKVAAYRFLRRVKLRKTQYKHMSSALPPNSDIARCSRHFGFVPPIPGASRRAGSIPGAQRTFANRRDTIVSSRGYFSVFGDGDRTTF